MNKKVKKAIKFIIDLVFIVCLCFFLLLLYNRLIKKDNSIFGYNILKVESGDIKNTFKANDYILIKKEINLKENDIVTYKTKDGVLLTNRVGKIDGNNFQVIDKNGQLINELLDKENIIGTYQKKLNSLGKFIVLNKLFIVGTIISIMLIYYILSGFKVTKVEEIDKKEVQE